MTPPNCLPLRAPPPSHPSPPPPPPAPATALQKLVPKDGTGGVFVARDGCVPISIPLPTGAVRCGAVRCGAVQHGAGVRLGGGGGSEGGGGASATVSVICVAAPCNDCRWAAHPLPLSPFLTPPPPHCLPPRPPRAGSCLVLKGTGGDHAMHCVPAVEARRISITLRRCVRAGGWGGCISLRGPALCLPVEAVPFPSYPRPAHLHHRPAGWRGFTAPRWPARSSAWSGSRGARCLASGSRRLQRQPAEEVGATTCHAGRWWCADACLNVCPGVSCRRCVRSHRRRRQQRRRCSPLPTSECAVQLTIHGEKGVGQIINASCWSGECTSSSGLNEADETGATAGSGTSRLPIL